MLLNFILGGLALLSLALTLWQWWVARRFPLHRRVVEGDFPPAATLLKPLKGCDETTAACLRSWFEQDYTGRVEILFGVAGMDDPVCEVVRTLLKEFPDRDARLIHCERLEGANAKVAKLAQLERLARHDVVVISDADVRVPPDLLTNLVAPLRDPSVGLVNCLYRLANPTTAALRWEEVAINADFWSQVLQSRSLKPIDFALGAVMVTRRKQLAGIGGFAALADCLADDYQLGHRIAQLGHRIELCPVVVECWSAPMTWAAVWKHQLRWARTIRVCQPAPYFFSLLSNATLWPLVWLGAAGSPLALGVALGCLAVRVATALSLQRRLKRNVNLEGRSPKLETELEVRSQKAAGGTTESGVLSSALMVWLKDLLQVAIWVMAFAGNTIEWRGVRLRLRRDGTIIKTGS